MAQQKVRLTERVLVHLEGSGLFLWNPTARSRPGWYDPNDPAYERKAAALMEKIEGTPTRKDGSKTVVLADHEVDILRGYIEGMEIGGRDNAWDPDSRADYNAARSLLNKIGRRPLHLAW